MEVERGSFFCTLRELQSEFMWRSDSRVRNFLKMLETERMIERETNAGKTHVTICNYDEYQQAERTGNARETQTGTQAERKRNALNNKETIKQEVLPPKPPSETALDILSKVASAEVVENFLGHRSDKKKPVSNRAAKMMAKKLSGYGTAHADAALNMTIENDWQGVFPEKINLNGGQHGHGNSAPNIYPIDAKENARRNEAERLSRIIRTAAAGTTQPGWG